MHAGQLAEETPVLAVILRKSEIGKMAEQYEEKDKEAAQAQIVFKKTANRAYWAVFLTACFAAILWMMSPLAAS